MCQFPITFSGEPALIIDKASQTIKGAGGVFEGDTGSGTFSLSTAVGKISGSYTVAGQILEIAIADKPFFVSCVMIEDQLKKSLGGL